MDYDPMVMDTEASGPTVKITEVISLASANLLEAETYAHNTGGRKPR